MVEDGRRVNVEWWPQAVLSVYPFFAWCWAGSGSLGCKVIPISRPVNVNASQSVFVGGIRWDASELRV